MIESNNMAYVSGKVASKPEFNHEICGEKFYGFNLASTRLSGTDDTIPVIISERMVDTGAIQEGIYMYIGGQFRSWNMYDSDRGHTRLQLFLFAKEAEFMEEAGNGNDITLHGFLCKGPHYRVTPLGRGIADVVIAVNRAYNKSDYIPCIAWGRNARFISMMDVGTELTVRGRIQSRNYTKRLEGAEPEERTVYEVSISTMEQA